MTWTVSDSWTQLPGASVVVRLAPLSVVKVTEPVRTNSGLLQGSRFVAKQSTGNSTLESRDVVVRRQRPLVGAAPERIARVRAVDRPRRRAEKLPLGGAGELAGNRPRRLGGRDGRAREHASASAAMKSR